MIANCLRTSENWAHINKEHRFDKKTFDSSKMLDDIPNSSPKMHELIQNIRNLDKNDMAKHGKMFKHFIFSDVKMGGYGAKIIASSLIASGFNSCFNESNYNKIELRKPKYNAARETFGLLCSTTIYNDKYTKSQIREILRMYNSRPDNIYGENMRFIIFDSGFKEGIDLFDVKYVHIFEKQHNSADLTQAVGRATRSCGQRGLNFVPNEGWKLHVYQYYSIYKNPMNNWNADVFNSWYEVNHHEHNLFDKYLLYKGVDLNKLVFKENLEKLAILSAVDYDLNYNINKFEKNVYHEYEEDPIQVGSGLLYGCEGGKCGSRSTKTVPFSITMMKQVYKESNLKLPKNYNKLKSTDKRQFLCDMLKTNKEFCKNVNLHYLTHKNKKKTTTGKFLLHADNLEKYDFEEFQKRIFKMFKKYKYPPLKIENQCVATNSKDDDRIIDYTMSQDFIYRYFTPKLKQKGILVWHSVGTGKTCTALATKSYLFEKNDYSILWVTRTTLKEDIWKNMFEKICDHTIRERIKKGETIPVNPDNIRKYLYKKFLPPMSYRQFSNTLLKKNDTYLKLEEVNGKTDILKKTLIIIDEAHKLYGNDLIAAEKPNMKAIESVIFNSYAKSGKDSCKLMLMTATPIADDAMEFFKLLNLLIGKETDRFPTTFDDMKSTFIESDTNSFSKQGKNQFQEKTKGLISYLNRRYDPRQFAQPIFYDVPVHISELPTHLNLENCNKEATDKFNVCTNDLSIDRAQNDFDNKKRDIETELQNLQNDKQLVKTKITEIRKIKRSKKTIQIDFLNVRLSQLEDELSLIDQKINNKKKDLQYHKRKLKTTLKEINDQLKTCKNTLALENKKCLQDSRLNNYKYQDTKIQMCMTEKQFKK